ARIASSSLISAGATPTSVTLMTCSWRLLSRCIPHGAHSNGSCAMPSRRATGSVLANSDGHKGRPGACYPGASFFGSQGGLTCFVAPQLSRDAIFEAMRRRHHYATTGNRMILNVTVRLPKEADIFSRDPAFDSTVVNRSHTLMMGDIAQV